MIYAHKITKFPYFYMIFNRKIFSQNLGGGGRGARVLLPTPVSYAYAYHAT